MADGNEQQPIIVKRVKRGGHGGHHGGAWKVAFADFMTAMMAFFMVMWLVGQKPEVREAVGGYFRDPGKYQREGAAGVLKGSASVIPRVSSDVGLKSAQADSPKGPSDVERKTMNSAAKRIAHELEKQEAFQRLKKNVKMQMTSEGLRIILNESENSPAFFEPGSAKLLQKSAVILITIARELGQLNNRISIEGHTDANYAGRKGYTNWELSTDRANSARQLMEVSGLSPDQIREVRGYADRFPMIMDKPSDARNRRVTLLVLYQSSESTYDQLEVGADLMAEIEAEG
ncbi:MAG: OmpA family protein [candidate division Zixibacteria bacterium]|nr:OmpA family protein [candidate division Zixibacteria bacterium]MDH3938023.1 OmpA family protein [candidate division Zixibacteria bacterium]MDH4034887.1 OmpA family protein [candidate division Zixibacteria bacterium]